MIALKHILRMILHMGNRSRWQINLDRLFACEICLNEGKKWFLAMTYMVLPTSAHIRATLCCNVCSRSDLWELDEVCGHGVIPAQDNTIALRLVNTLRRVIKLWMSTAECPRYLPWVYNAGSLWRMQAHQSWHVTELICFPKASSPDLATSGCC